MMEYLEALAMSPLMQSALLAGLLASLACGVVGTYVVVRRITYIAGGIAHCVLGGLGGALYLNKVQGWTWLQPIHGAIAAALAAAGAIAWVTLRLRQREDTVISALWAGGMSAGVIFLYMTPGYAQDLLAYLFGDITIVSSGRLWLLVALDGVVLVLAALFYKQFLAVCCDEEFARVRGVRTEGYYLLLLGLTAVTVVLLATVVGILLVIALLTLPVAVASLAARRLWHMMLLAAVLSALLTASGMAISYAPGWPAGPVIVLLAVGVYVVALVAASLARRLR